MNVRNSYKNTTVTSQREIYKSPTQWWRSVFRQKKRLEFIKKIREDFEIEVGQPDELTDDTRSQIRHEVERFVNTIIKLGLHRNDTEVGELFRPIIDRIRPDLIEGFEYYILTGKYPDTYPEGINGGVSVIDAPTLTGGTYPMIQVLVSEHSDIEAITKEFHDKVNEIYGKAKSGKKTGSGIGLWWEGLSPDEQNSTYEELARQYLFDNPNQTRLGIPTPLEIHRYSDRLRKFIKLHYSPLV